jgi:hypothetical protein
MECNCTISISYAIYIDPDTIEVPEFELTPLPYLYNNQSIYQWTDTNLNIDFVLRFNGTNWVIVAIDGATLCSTLNSSLALICPVQENIDNNWVDEDGSPIFHIITYGTCEVNPVCVAWNTDTINTIPDPWDQYTFVFDETPANSSFYVGQGITYFSSDLPLVFAGTEVYYVFLIFYTSDGINFYTEDGPGRYIYGIVLEDSDGEFIIPQTESINTGYLCVEPAYQTPDEINQECFDILVWNKQCEFGQCVLNYTKLLKFGIVPCDMLDNLKNKKRVLEILNCYDTRDIQYNTTDYNVLPYSTIKKLLNY